MGNINDIELTFLTHNDTTGLCDLYIDVFNRKVDADYFTIKYGLNLGVNQFSVVARINGSVVGFFGGIEQEFVFGTKKMKLLSCGDYALKKELRGQKVFDLLYEKMKSKIKAEAFDYAYAFQSEQTYKVAKKWGWKDEAGMKRVQLDVFPFSTYRLFNKLGLSRYRKDKLEKELISYQVDKKGIIFSEENKFIHQYDDIFFQMKRFAHHYWVEIEGCILALKYDYRITVGYIQITPSVNIPNMLRILKKIARRCFIHEVVFHIQEDSIEAKQLAKYMPLKKSFQVSSLKLNEHSPSFSEVKLNFMDMDVF